MAKAAKSTKRTRRTFAAEFKHEAVRRMAERRAHGVSVQQIGRDLGERPDLLRVWAHQVAAQGGGAPLADVFPRQDRLPSEQDELWRLEREVKRLAHENASSKGAAAYFARESR